MKKKSDVFNALKEYEAMFDTKISKLITYQGREYLSKEQHEWYKQKGIQIETKIVYGVAERFNRTLMEKVRAMLFESNVQKICGMKVS